MNPITLRLHLEDAEMVRLLKSIGDKDPNHAWTDDAWKVMWGVINEDSSVFEAFCNQVGDQAEHFQLCSACDGSGEVDGDAVQLPSDGDCPRCGGRGFTPRNPKDSASVASEERL